MTAAPADRPWQAGTMRRWLFAIGVLVLAGWEPFRTADPDVEAGNRAYAEGRYDDALAAYDRAGRRGGVDADGLAFDRGTAELKKADAAKEPAEKRRLIERALDDLKRAGRARDARVRGAASYNRGNALLGQDKLADAIEAYKQALRDDGSLDDARLNLEIALRRRQQQQSQQGQGQGQGQQGPGQGQGQQGQGQGQGPQGQDAQGQGNGGGSSDPQRGNGANPPSSGNGQGQPQGGGNGQGNPSAGSDTGSGGGSQSPDPRDPGNQAGSGQPRGRPQRGHVPRSPRTPNDAKLDDLDDYSRRLQKDRARRQATVRAGDPQHDW